jgi:micrococcal nuclease
VIRTSALALAALLAAAVLVSAQDVTRVVSADTIEVAGIGKIRLVGIESREPAVRLGPTGPVSPSRSDPSTPPPPLIGGSIGVKQDPAARQFLMELVLGKRVRLEYDDASNKRKGTPRAYVYLDDDTLVNAEMLRSGNARVDTSRPFAQMEKFKAIEQEARDAEVGIWADGGKR